MSRFLRTDSCGYFVPEADSAAVSHDAQRIAAEIMHRVTSQFGDSIASIFLRGSSTRGMFFDGKSDIDFFVLTTKSFGRNEANLLRATATHNLDPKPFTKIDIDVFEREAFLCSPHLEGERFLLKYYGLPMFGQDVRASLDDWGPNRDIRFVLNRLPESMRIFIRKTALRSEQQFRSWLPWLAKRVVRSGLELVLPRTLKFTRDLPLCEEVFSNCFPQKQTAMKTAVRYAIGDCGVGEEWFDAAEKTLDFGRWIVAAFSQLETQNTLSMNTSTLRDEDISTSLVDSQASAMTDPNDGANGDTDKNDSNSSDG